MKYRRRLYKTDYCLSPFEKIPNSAILCQGEKIIAVGGASAFQEDHDLEIVDLKGCYAIPGFIDTHIHGAAGFDSTAAHEAPDEMKAMCQILASHGVTSFLPTIVSAPLPEMFKALDTLATLIDMPSEGADPLAIHCEGPFINKKKHGSQCEEFVQEIDLGVARDIIDAGRGKIKIMTFAPELPGAIQLIELLRENDIIPSMGHSLAVESDVLKAVDAGATRCTHIFNGMPPLHQRHSTLSTVALTDDRITIELIMDGSHLHPKMIDLACRIKPQQKIIGVSDSIQGAGMMDGIYHLGGAQIQVVNGKSTTEDGTLAGTTLTLEKGWHHLVTHSHMSINDAAACFSFNPANDMKLRDRGEIKPNRRADLVIFDSKTNRVKMTVVRGEIVYVADED